MSCMDFDAIYRMEVTPTFVPAKDHLNCDPTFELEEMIIEAKPLHKKKKRLAKQGSKTGKDVKDINDPMQICLENINAEFKVYNRDRLKQEKDKIEKDPEVKEEQVENNTNSPIKVQRIEGESVNTLTNNENGEHTQNTKPASPEK
ncbi:serine/threonine-protein kinase 32B-like [Saccoglossus kowalevskii]|uniref:Serine/threonine-protein kinase 32B-like n=1 Tax=Saccoglossus kowalevskii TaxID=10224 RepID=A0ABM0M7B1_SACKO|nr:PREDICTED: serine/threonine-protein kinase 32B-like [Saccoglossus kowalevskii]